MTTDDYTLKESGLHLDSDPRPTLAPYKQDYKFGKIDVPDFIDNAIAKLKRSAAMILGDDDAVRDAFYYSRELAGDLKDNDKTEDTLRHILLGGLVKSDIGQWYINFREDDVGVEEQIDLNNNEYGRILRNKYPDPNDFLNAAFGAAMAIGQGKEPEVIEGFKPMLSLGTAKPDTESPKLKPFIDEEGTKVIPSAPEPNIPMPKATDDYTQDMNKGGTIMDKQMKMAFMDNGGLQDDGMDRDPVSGNDVPSGSLAEEVRDDIPAQLSEGEYVVPADVVRFFGVKFFEDLRMQAKMGLAQMERSGRIGGEPIKDNGEMMDSDDEALIIAMTPDMNKGGVVRMKGGGLTDEEKEAAGLIDGRYPQPYRDTLRDYSFVGSSLFSPRKQDDVTNEELTEETWYHPDGRSMTIMRNADGAVVPASDSKFTQAPWSTSKPEESITDTPRDAAEPTSKAQDRAKQVARWDFINKQREAQNLNPIVFPGMNQDWYKNRQQSSVKLATNPDTGIIDYSKVLTNDFGEVVQLSEQNFKAIEQGFNKNKAVLTAAGVKSMDEYHKLSPLDRVKLTQYEGKELTPANINAIKEITKEYYDEEGNFTKGFSLINPLASTAAGFVGEKLRGKDVYAGGEYISPKQQELIEFLYNKQAQLGKGALNKTEQDQLAAFENVYGKDGINFKTTAGDTRFTAGFNIPETTSVSSSDSSNKGGSGGVDNLEETITPTFVPPKAGSDLSGGSTKKAGAAKTTMDIAQGKETKAEKQARQDRIKAAQDRYKKAKDADDEKEMKKSGTEAMQLAGKGYVGGSGFTKGGLASKPKPKSKVKRTTKGLGTKPKAT